MKDNLDKKEKEILESYEKGDWNSIPNVEGEIDSYREIAKNTLKKDKRINIRISNRDLLEIKRKAVHEGIPYQTLISSILHKFLNGRLVNKAD
ncbi:MAG: antitoxin [Prolixibacteraceae bacterium]|mgnify:CR=1 FL=1|jgi:predicted DNA binding CopG/RHH family protein|nr:antitoxin [Prolixibacteraceae bacterium]MBT6764134.1 antitoxin [Prolixibacteraceae bacterium]MBT6999003.1 antitoxin [Prolixibacteraceae bacterium]MBT7394498.1 antitoxin [Prolixibacteraceae bacterium]